MIKVNSLLFKHLTDATVQSLTMANLDVTCSGVLTHVQTIGAVTGALGLVGDTSGMLSVSLPAPAALAVMKGLTGTTYDRITTEVLDGVGEMANMIGGALKNKLFNTPYQVSRISLPAVITGSSYQITNFRGMECITCLFDLNLDTPVQTERMVSVSLSVMKTPGG